LRDFLRFYREDGCFVDNEDSWTNWLGKKIGQNVTIDKDNIFIEGESAGGHAAVTTMFLNAVKTAQPLHIKAVFLRYPMLKHYKRKWPEAGSVEFMGQNFSQAEIQDYEKELKAEVLALETLKSNEQTGFVRTRTKGYAPEYMWAAPLLSLTGEWQWMFQRDHGLGKEQTIDESLPWNLDCLERAEKMHDKVNHACLPPTIMHHAYDDTNCPYPDTQKFKELFHQYYPTAYPQGDEKVLLIGVGQLMSHPRVLEGTMSESTVGHGYDYWQDDEAFQLESYKRVENYWPVTAGV
jgi:acetyl esterase/lipase